MSAELQMVTLAIAPDALGILTSRNIWGGSRRIPGENHGVMIFPGRPHRSSLAGGAEEPMDSTILRQGVLSIGISG
jgi:hypothetical protein